MPHHAAACRAVRRAAVEALEGRQLFSAGDLDLSYGGGDGVNAVAPGGHFTVHAVDHRGGRTVTLGTVTDGYDDPTAEAGLIVFDNAGRPDSSFSGDGRVTIPQIRGGTDLVVQPDGKVLVVGRTGSTPLVARLTAAGALDPTFSGDGLATLSQLTSATSVRLAADGKIVVGGAGTGPVDDPYQPGQQYVGTGFAAARLNANGTFDTSFGGDGQVVTSMANLFGSSSVAVQADGRVVLVGSVPQTYSDIGVVRLTAAGGYDPSFGGDGRAQFDYSDDDFGQAVDVTPSGQILVGAVVGELAPVALRLAPDGSLVARTEQLLLGQAPTVNDVRSSADGSQFYVFANIDQWFGGSETVVYRFDIDGTPDHTFGPGGQGYVRTVGGEGFGDLTADGRIVAVGNPNGSAPGDRPQTDPTRVQTSRRLPATTPADRVRVANGTLYIEGTAGADTVLVEELATRQVRVTLNGTAYTVGGATTAINRVDVGAGNGNDTVTSRYNRDTVVVAGDGDDKVVTAGGKDQLDGGFGNDRLDGGLGGDLFRGGPGTDTIDYGARGAAVTVDLRDSASLPEAPRNDGQAGEGDDARGDIEVVVGGRGNDTIRGSAAANFFYGNAGDDLLDGGAGADLLDGGPGRDRLYGGGGNDTLYGGADADAPDYLGGGAGYDKARKDAKDAVFSIEQFI